MKRFFSILMFILHFFLFNTNVYIAAQKNQEVFVAGDNTAGQLGTSLPFDYPQPGLPVVQFCGISLGQAQVLYLTQNGTVYVNGYSWGQNLGVGDSNRRDSPSLVRGVLDGVNITSIHAGWDTSWYISSPGDLYTTGQNDYGQLGIGSVSLPYLSPVMSGFPSGTVAKVSSGLKWTIALSRTGIVRTVGRDLYGTLGRGVGSGSSSLWVTVNIVNETVVDITSTQQSAYAVTQRGTSYAWGLNTFGQLCVGDTNQRNSPVQVANLTNIKTAVGGVSFILFLLGDGTVAGCGDNSVGSLGILNGRQSVLLPMGIPGFNTVKKVWSGPAAAYASGLQLADGRVYVTGNNINGNLGFDTYTNLSTPILLPFSVQNDIISMEFTLDSTGILYNNPSTGNGQIRLIGKPFSGTASFQTPVLGIAGGSSKVSCSSKVCTSVSADSSDLYVWGLNSGASLGTGDTFNRNQPTFITSNISMAVVSTHNSGYALSTSGKVYLLAIGANHANGYNNSVPNKGITLNPYLPSNIVSIATADDYLIIGQGGSFAMALTANGSVWSWGCNNFGSLGTSQYAGLGDLSCAPGVSVAIPTHFVPFKNVISIAAGTASHSLFLLSNRTVFATGSNLNGQLCNPGAPVNAWGVFWPVAMNNVTAIAASQFSSYMTVSDRELWVCGWNDKGQLGKGDTLQTTVPIRIIFANQTWNIAKVAAFAKHVMMLTSNGLVYAWGNNIDGQLGLGDFVDRLVPTLVPVFPVVDVSVGDTQSAIVTGCPKGRSGPNCEYYVCFGIPGSFKKVCSGQGVCTGIDTCTCNPGSSGNQCQSSKYRYQPPPNGAPGVWGTNTYWLLETGASTLRPPSDPLDEVYFIVPGTYTVTVDVPVASKTIVIGALNANYTLVISNKAITASTSFSIFSGSSVILSNSALLNLPSEALIDGHLEIDSSIISKGSLVGNGTLKLNNAQILSTSITIRSVGVAGNLNCQNSVISSTQNSFYQNVHATLQKCMLYPNDGTFSGVATGDSMSNITVGSAFSIIDTALLTVNIINTGKFTIRNCTVHLSNYTQHFGSNLILSKSNITSLNTISIQNGNANLEGIINAPSVNLTSSDGIIRITGDITINGNFYGAEQSTFYLSIFGYTKFPVPQVIVSGIMQIFGFIIVDPGLDGQKVQIGDRIQIFRIGNIPSYVFGSRNFFLIGAPYKNTDYDINGDMVSLRIIPSYGSVTNPTYKCTYLGEKRMLEYTPYYQQNKIILAVTIPVTSNDVLFGLDFRGDLNSSLLTRSKPFLGFITPFNQQVGQPTYLLASAAQSQNIFSIGPNYFTITLLLPISYLSRQENLYFSEIYNETQENLTWSVYSYRVMNSTEIDCTNFIEPSRGEVYGPVPGLGIGIVSVMYLIVFILCILVVFKRPMNTRGVSPFLALFFLFLQLMLEIRNYFEIPVYQGSLCVYLALGFYPLQQIVFVMILLYFIRYFAIINLNEYKNSLITKLANKEKTPIIATIRTHVMKIIASFWFTIIFIILGYLFMVVTFLIVLGGYKFVCKFETLVVIKILNNVGLISIYMLIIVTLVIDILSNHKKIFRQCHVIDYIFFSDPYWFRVQIILFLPFMVYSLIVQVYSLIVASTFVGIVVNHATLVVLDTINAHVLLILDVLFPMVLSYSYLFMTMLRKKRPIDQMEIAMNDPIVAKMLLEFCKTEFSVENYQSYVEIKEYEKSPNETDAKHIYATYLNGEASVMEINIDLKTRRDVAEKIANREFIPTLFNGVMKGVLLNLSDTWGRFTFSSKYVRYIDSKKNQIEMIEGSKLK